MNEWKLAGRALGVGSTLVVLPFLFLCLYWHPVGTHGVDWISNWGGKYDAMGWWAQQADWYQTTMGRYSSTALLSTVSYWYSLHTARIVVLGIHLGLVACLYYFFRCLYGNGKRSNSAVCALAVMALYLNQLSNPYDLSLIHI